MTKVHHLTLNTGSLAAFDPADCHRGQVRDLRRLYPKGGGLPSPWQDLRIDFGDLPGGGVSFAIWRADVPMIMNVVCWSASHSAECFASIEHQYHSLSEKFPEAMSLFGTATHIEPPATPWLATLLLPSIFQALPMEALQAKLSTIAKLEQATAASMLPPSI